MLDRDIVRLLHIRDAINAIESYAAVGHERFLAETMTHDAIIWQLEVICEATKRLSADLRERCPEFASGRLREVQEEFDRNFFEFDLSLAWAVSQETLPELRRTVEAVLAEERRVNTA